MIDFDSDAKLNILGARWNVSRTMIEQERAPDFVRELAFSRLREQLASELSISAMQVTGNKYSVDYEIRLYVLTPDQLEKYVQRRAERLRYGNPFDSITEEPYPVKEPK